MYDYINTFYPNTTKVYNSPIFITLYVIKPYSSISAMYLNLHKSGCKLYKNQSQK